MARASRRTKEARGKARADGVVTLADIAAQSERSLKRLEEETRTRGRGGEERGARRRRRARTMGNSQI